MHRQSQQEVAAAARRRLELLGRELDQAGLRRVDDSEPAEEESGAGLPGPAVVTPVGRHLREPRPGVGRRLSGWVADQVPDTLRGRTELGSGPVLLVVALVALAVTGAVFAVARMQPRSEPVPAGAGPCRHDRPRRWCRRSRRRRRCPRPGRTGPGPEVECHRRRGREGPAPRGRDPAGRLAGGGRAAPGGRCSGPGRPQLPEPRAGARGRGADPRRARRPGPAGSPPVPARRLPIRPAPWST